MEKNNKNLRSRPSNFKAVLKNIDKDDVEIFADLGAGSSNLATQFYKRFGSQILVVPVNGKGEFDRDSASLAESYCGRLENRGVDMSRVHVLRPEDEVSKVDVISTIGTFGDKYNIKSAKKWIDKLLSGETRWITDIRKGSGGYRMARGVGNTNTLLKFQENKAVLARCIVSEEPKPVTEARSEDIWKTKAETIIGSDGFYRANHEHSFTYIPRGKTLVVTFDNLDIAMKNRSDRLPWGYSYIEKEGYSMLGVMANRWTWYRDPWVFEQFNQLRAEGFFDQFERVVFYGASMGGYAALAFAPAAKNKAQVVVFSPQSTVDKKIVPWETRYKAVWKRDFSGEYGDAAKTALAAKSVYLFYDPYQKLDSQHAQRIQGPNIHHYHAPLMGHKLGTNFLRMGVLQSIVNDSIQDKLTKKRFHKYMAARKQMRRYLMELFNLAKEKKHYLLAYRVANYAHQNDPRDKFFEKHRQEMAAKIK